MATYDQSWMKTAHNKGHEPPPKLDEEVALLRQEAVITISSPDNDQQYELNDQKSIPKTDRKKDKADCKMVHKDNIHMESC